jgi:hypothetical protein
VPDSGCDLSKVHGAADVLSGDVEADMRALADAAGARPGGRCGG